MLVKSYIFGLILFAVTIQNINAEYNITAYCTRVKSNTKIPSIESCQKYYICQSDGSYKEALCSKKESFDKNAQSCLSEDDVSCYYGDVDPCKKATEDGFIPEAKTCNGWIYCADGKESNRGKCDEGLIFSNGRCQYGECSDEDGDYQPQTCEIVPDNVFFGSLKQCKIYNKCKDGKLTEDNCPDQTVYDVDRFACVDQELNTCDRVTGDDSDDEDDSCEASDEGQKIADDKNCDVYKICTNEKLKKVTCQNDQYYDINVESCVSRKTATPIATCDRCKGTTKMFVNKVDKECRGYYYCENGKKSSENSCDEDYYLNEDIQACMPVQSMGNYAKENGACYTTPAPPTEAPTQPTDPPTQSTDETTKSTDAPTQPTDPTTQSTDETTISTEAPSNPDPEE